MIILGLGTNQGACREHLQVAIGALRTIGNVVSESSVWESPAWGYTSDHLYLNQVVLFETNLTPKELLLETQRIERNMGRTQKTVDVYKDRIIDIDILAYNEVQQKTDELTIPHPLMQQRNFVLMPLVEIAPNWIHPTLQKSAQRLFEESPDHNFPTKVCS